VNRGVSTRGDIDAGLRERTPTVTREYRHEHGVDIGSLWVRRAVAAICSRIFRDIAEHLA